MKEYKKYTIFKIIVCVKQMKCVLYIAHILLLYIILFFKFINVIKKLKNKILMLFIINK